MVQQGHNYMHYGFVYHQIYQLFEAKHVELAGVHINLMYGIITTVLYIKKYLSMSSWYIQSSPHCSQVMQEVFMTEILTCLQVKNLMKGFSVIKLGLLPLRYLSTWEKDFLNR